jgi:hypothetical protein
VTTSAIDQALHSIAEHEDGSKNVDSFQLQDYVDLGFPELTNPIEFVKMLKAERDKLSGISNAATDFTVSIESNGVEVLYESGNLEMLESDTIKWEIVGPNQARPVLGFSVEYAHRHYYNQIPNSIPNEENIDYKKFEASPYPFIEGSLRVYVNGVRLNDEFSVYHPNLNPLAPWKLNTYIPNHTNGTFELDVALTEYDIIQVDFDIQV